jgi:hypothetical protein
MRPGAILLCRARGGCDSEAHEEANKKSDCNVRNTSFVKGLVLFGC